MKRRAFIAALPALAAAPAFAQERGAPLLPAWPAGAERYDRPDVHPGDRPAGASFSARSAAYGRSGAAGTAHPLATLAAIDILRRGGSAADAAIAANACLGFLEPTSSGIGGDVFVLLWDPRARKVMSLASSGASPRGLSLETARARAIDGVLPKYGAISVSVPGAVAGWGALHERYGKLKWSELFAPAIDLAEQGAPLPQVIGASIHRNLDGFTRTGSGVEETANAMKVWAAAGHVPREGEVFRNPDLARTYRTLAAGGARAYYEGDIARHIASYFKRIGGWMTADDLARHKAEWIEPLVTKYRGVDVYAMGANTQGLATLQMLNILETFDLKSMGFQSPASLHHQVEAKRLAYEDRARFYADPHFVRVPTDWLNSKSYAAERAKLIRPDRILDPAYPGQAPSHGDTTYFSVADKDGMMVSIIQSNFRGMGSGLMPDGPDGRTLGFMFQDRGELFSLKDGHPNVYAPGKRPFQTIIPGFACKDGAPWMSFGVMGGDMQPQGQAQILIDRIEYGLDIEAAGDSPRWHHEGSSQSMGEDPAGLGPKGILRLERGVPAATRQALIDLGWPMGASDGGFGRYECIENRMSGGDRVYAAASEMRADGMALAY